MKKIVIAFFTVALLGLTTSAQRQFLSDHMRTTAGSVSKSLSVGLIPFSCTCSCGKNCDGSCLGHYAGCSAYDGISCVIDCCDAAPNAGGVECMN